MANQTTSILIVGVGGQGTLLASRVLGNLLLSQGHDVKVSEVHGMSQRGGSVVTYIRYGDKVHSPIVTEGEADVIIAFEELEAYRWMPYLKKGGMLVVNKQNIVPMPVIIGAASYPTDILTEISKKYENTIAVDALSIALECGSAKATNIVLLGVLAAKMHMDKQLWLDTIQSTVPPKFLDLNIAAFEAGYGR